MNGGLPFNRYDLKSVRLCTLFFIKKQVFLAAGHPFRLNQAKQLFDEVSKDGLIIYNSQQARYEVPADQVSFLPFDIS
jgi:hypothetical protein